MYIRKGGVTMNVYLLALGFNVVDFISGFIAGAKTEGVQSQKMREGLFHKAGFVLLYLMCFMIEYSQNFIQLPFTKELSVILVTYVIIMETISIIENIAKINPDIMPEKIKQLIGIGDTNESE